MTDPLPGRINRLAYRVACKRAGCAKPRGPAEISAVAERWREIVMAWMSGDSETRLRLRRALEAEMEGEE